MAKIVFYSNPLDPTEKKEIEHNGTIRGALEELGIENRPLALVINGENPDEVDTSAILAIDDVVEIHTPVHGSKGDWATILSVASIAALFIPGYGVAISIGLGLAAGALAASHMKDMAKDATTSARGIGINDASPSRASNEVRPLQPIPVLLGEIRFAPDVYTNTITQRDVFSPHISVAGTPAERAVTMEISAERFSTQTFCYGFGDLVISDRRYGSLMLEDVTSGFGSYIHKVMSQHYGLYYATLSSMNVGGYFHDLAIAPVSVKRFPDSEVYNNDASEVLISANDMAPRNWLLFEGDKHQDRFAFTVSGISFYTRENQQYPSSAKCKFQFQYKYPSDSVWRTVADTPLAVWGGANEEHVTFTFTPTDWIPGATLQVRIRLVTPWNFGSSSSQERSQRMAITDAFFYTSDTENIQNNEELGQRMFPMHIEGLLLSNNLAGESTDKGYSANVAAKCWHIVTDVGLGIKKWTWAETKNPAWWFFYYARGGYRNIGSRSEVSPAEIFIPQGGGKTPEEWAAEVAPESSPTNYWQNYKDYKGSAQNEELVFGGGYTNGEIDIPSILQWASFCDEQGITIGMVMRDDFTLMEGLEQIANVGRASVSYDTGKLSVVWEAKDQVPVTMFGMANIIAGSFAASYRSNINLRRVKAKFSNKDDDYNTDTVEAVVPFSDPASIEATEVTLVGVTDPAVAQREVNLIAARQFFQTRSYSWKTDQEGFLARRGDLVYLSHDSTQFGYSGRVVNFIFDDSDNVIGLRGSSLMDSEVSWIMVRLPNSEMVKMECHFSDGIIYFDEEFPIADAPYHIRYQRRKSKNLKSRFPGTTADDYIYIADIKETIGKIVRISTVETDENHNFTYTAVDEDPAMWAFENGVDIDPESTDDAIGIIEVYDCSVSYIGEGVVELSFNASDDALFMFVNQTTEQPIEINGRFSTSEKTVRLELDEGVPVVVKIVPLSVTENVQSRSLEVELWQA